MSMYHLAQQNPRATVLAAYPRATCKKRNGYGAFDVVLNDGSGRSIATGTQNPAQAWEYACLELRLGVFADIRANPAK